VGQRREVFCGLLGGECGFLIVHVRSDHGQVAMATRFHVLAATHT
jgi:hypothetical protein